MKYKTIKIEKDNHTATITLNRPEKKNAINSRMIKELTKAFKKLNKKENIRLITITGAGDTFSSGADLKWLKEVKDYSYNENYNDSMNLVALLRIINEHKKPIICKVNGTAVGGGVGIMLASDIILADKDSKFGLSEVGIGIIPAAIVPYIISRIGETKARELLITGNRIKADEAREMGLVNYSLDKKELEKKYSQLAERIIANGPTAVTKVKEMINHFNNKVKGIDEDYIARVISELRTSEEGSEGIDAFLEKRKPSWSIENKN
jgi:methylglutaconyl-CoA hydratase